MIKYIYIYILPILIVYFKICDGFFLIFDPTKIESVNFIKKHLDNIIEHSLNQNIFLIANINFLNKDFNKLQEYQNKFWETDVYVKELVNWYDLKVHYINIDELQTFKNQIKKFVCISYIKKGVSGVKISSGSSSSIYDKKKIRDNYERDRFTKKIRNDRKSHGYPLVSDDFFCKYILII